MRITRREMVAGAIGAPLAGALVWDLFLSEDEPKGDKTEGHLFDGTRSSSAYRDRWTDEAVAAAGVTLVARNRFKAAVFTRGLGSVDWRVEADDSGMPSYLETDAAKVDWLKEKAENLRPELDALIHEESSHGSDPLGALEAAAQLPRLSKVRIWSDMITQTKEAPLGKVVPDADLDRLRAIYVKRLKRLSGVPVFVYHGGRGISKDEVVRQNEELVRRVLAEVGAPLHWLPTFADRG